MDNSMIGLMAFFFGLCIGIVIMSVLADRTNKRETDKLREEMANNSRLYYEAVSTMESQIEAKESELQLKQRVLNTLNDEIHRLRRKKQKQKGGQLCG